MSTRRAGCHPTLVGLLCFLLGIPVGAAALYLLQHPGAIHRPLYLAIFTGVAFASLAAADRALNYRSTASNCGDRPVA